MVIEIKAGEATENAVAQILRYIGWVKFNLAGGKGVRGIIVAGHFSDRTKYAASSVPDLGLKNSGSNSSWKMKI